MTERIPVQCFLLFLLLMATRQALSQPSKVIMDQLAGRLNAYTDNQPQASVYLRTSKDIFESVEDLWFKAYLLDAQSYVPFGLDKTLYVRLVNKNRDSVVWEEKYFVKNGVAAGHIFLDRSLPEGDYFLSAYSAHSFYNNRPHYQAIKMVKVIRQTNSLLKGKATGITSDLHPQQSIQFSILPEGGQLVSGIRNTVAFKAVDKSGEPLDVTGKLLQGNLPVTTFKSAHAGMGSFYFTPIPGVKYQVQLTSLKTDKLYPLPAIRDKGMVIHLLKNEKDSLTFNIIQSPGSVKQAVFLRVQIRGRIQSIAAGILGDSLKVKIPTINLPQGIAEVTLFDQELRPLAERLVYLNPDKALNISTSLSRESYKTREKVSVKIKTVDKDGKPVPANIGVSVYDNIYHNAEDVKDILTHYYLSTQLKGKIYNPGYYFDPGHNDRKEAMDLLLLTQGWRCYLWNEDELKELKQGKQVLTDSTKGRLIAVNPKKTTPKQQMLMVFSTDESQKRMLMSDSSGQFALAPEDFVKGRWLYLKHFDAGNGKYTLSVEDYFKAIADFSKNMEYEYPVADRTMKEKKDDIPPGRMNMGTINLDEVKVVAKKQTVFRDKYMGHLDSLAKFEGNTDFVAPNSSWLNIPVGYGGTRPVEGKTYITWNGPNPPSSFPFSFDATNSKHVVYHYPKFTEEELLKKFNLSRIKGYYEQREFYQPDFDKEQNSLPDYRNTLLWAPDVITNENGEAIVEFFCSDINSSFLGIVEGIGQEGLLGKKEFHFNVVK
ncbi:hypothetical protein [Mucilaginibacter sp. SJ]|uniref:hypothetical protein n=1 Tax=Mucilaginibacter sp. SJ TaxID=3029053 RepID=UPI0023A9CC97|nr:hypothetical protein [Mucilaginibacter sp. SJ]WEA00578.1 hypothetical protein MusilaSJ_24285 [Mucilaginibacter sp. SJ]